MEVYAAHTCRALTHARRTFSGIRLHGRLAILLPDRDFARALRPMLQRALAAEFPDSGYQLVGAAAAVADLGARVVGGDHGGGGAGSSSSSSSSSSSEDGDEMDEDDEGKKSLGDGAAEKCQKEALLFDVVSECDGLERLIVIGVGLDSVVDEEPGPPEQRPADSAALETRSMIYRAMTRAQLMVTLVNEFVPGGWLEFLGHVRLRSDQQFDRQAEISRLEVSAVDDIIHSALAVAIAAWAESHALSISSEAVELLSIEAAAHKEQGEAEAAAVEAVLQGWQRTVAVVMDQLDTTCAMLRIAPLNAEESATLGSSISVALHRNQVSDLQVSCTSELTRLRQRRLATEADALLAAAVETHRTESSRRDSIPITPEDLVRMRGRVLSLLTTASSSETTLTDLAFLCSRAIDQWTAQQTDIADALSTAIATGCWSERLSACEAPPLSEHDAICSEISFAVCGGGVLEVATNAAMSRWWDRVLDKRAAVAVADGAEAALGYTFGTLAKRRVHREVKAAIDAGEEPQPAAARLRSKWRLLETEARDLLDGLRQASQLRMSEETAETLLPKIVEVAWGDTVLGSDALATGAPVQLHSLKTTKLNGARGIITGEKRGERWTVKLCSGKFVNVKPSNLRCSTAAAAAESVVAEWAATTRRDLENEAQISAELQAAASSERLAPTDAAFATLHKKVATAVAAGAPLVEAVAAALRGWKRQLVRNQVQQTVWDPSANSTSQTSGVVRFMPFKRARSEGLEYEMLVSIFRLLSFKELAAAALVCRRWNSVAADPSWQEEVLLYAWGAAELSGLAAASPQPVRLVFQMQEQILSVTCTDDATLALTVGGAVLHWGASWDPDREHTAVPTELPELADVEQLACTPAGYFHGRSRETSGYSCAALTRSGVLYTWGRNTKGQLLHGDQVVEVVRPRRVMRAIGRPGSRIALIGCGLDFLALCVTGGCDLDEPSREPQHRGVDMAPDCTSSVLSAGRFSRGFARHDLTEWRELRDVPIRQLACGAFYGCAVTKRGQVSKTPSWPRSWANCSL
jgi:hypothetical protein